MIRKDIETICKEFWLIENYDKAIESEELWDCHHRKEIDEMKSKQQLIDEGKYYNVKPKELIFLRRKDHCKLHGDNMRKEEKENRSFATSGENNPFYGKRHSEETRKKISTAGIGRAYSKESREKLSKTHIREKNPAFGCHWYNNGVVQILCTTPPEGFVKGRLKKC